MIFMVLFHCGVLVFGTKLGYFGFDLSMNVIDNIQLSLINLKFQQDRFCFSN